RGADNVAAWLGRCVDYVYGLLFYPPFADHFARVIDYKGGSRERLRRREAEDICVAGYYGSAISRGRLRQERLGALPAPTSEIVKLLVKLSKQRYDMLNWRPDPSRVPIDLRDRFLSWGGRGGSEMRGRDMIRVPAPNAQIANRVAARGFTVDDLELDPNSSQGACPPNETEVHQQPGTHAGDYPFPTDSDSATMEEMQAGNVQALPPPAICE
ncbi:unnamed protein product, partial [Prorocentrum cordatum]